MPSVLKAAVLSLYTTTEIHERLDYILPFFSEPLSIKTYVQYFHNLLYLEEIQLFHNMQKYDMDQAHFTSENLALEGENIAESRPSLVLGKQTVGLYFVCLL